jgi:murein DD-endopeptidase MepM/ murein hydrolase activator NlpD
VNYRSFLNRDYKSSDRSPAGRKPGHWRLRGLFIVIGCAILGVVLAKTHDPGRGAEPGVAEVADDSAAAQTGARVVRLLDLPGSPVTVVEPAVAPTPAEAEGDWMEVVVKSGDSLSAVFSRLEMHSQMQPILALGEPVKPMRKLFPGQRFRALKDESGLRELVFEPDELRRVRVWRDGDSYAAETIELALEARPRHATAVIRDSLFQAGIDAGLSENLIMELASIFGWDIDFALDIREGDQFTVIYEELYRDAERLRDGRILAAEFVNQGRSVQAVLFTRSDGESDYYSPDGRSMRKAFLRAPVDFRRISSRFQRERWHPVLGVKRPHRGVDYAAAIGTPIRAAGDGRVKFRGTKGGYGNTIIIQHGATYSTLYAHMSRYAGKTAVGTRVRQGQTIGYVGKSGLATGPHLHYEFLVNGVHRNPLTVKLPSAEPLPDEYHAAFKEHSEPLLAQLDLYRRTMLAEQ